MAQPFRRAWGILKKAPRIRPNFGRHDQLPPGPKHPYDTTPPMGPPTDWRPYERLPDDFSPHPDDPSDWPPRPDIEPYDPHTEPNPFDPRNPFDPSSRIAEIQTQIQRLEAELQRLLQMQAGAGGGGYPWGR